MSVDVGTATGYLDLDISGFLQGLQSAQSEANKITKNTVQETGEKIQAVGSKMESVGKTLTAGVTTPVVGLGTAIVKTSMDFEAGMSKVQAISGASGKELVDLREKAKEMGAKTKFSATESAAAFEYMAMAGWKTGDMLDGIEGIMNLAAASGEDLATTSDIVTDALTAFGLKASDSAHFSDILATASSNANTNVGMMGETFKYCAPVAGALGFSAEDTALAIGLMANSGIKASQAGTSLRSIMTNLTGDIELQGEKLGKVTIATTNADGSMRGLNEILTDCRASFSQLSESEQAAAAEALVGKTAMSGFLAIMNAAPEDIDKLTSSIDNCDGASKKMADTMNDNLAGQITLLKSALEGLAIQLGEIIVPYVKDFVTVLQGLVQAFSNLPKPVQSMIIKFAFIAALVGPIVLVLGKFVSTIGSIVTVAGKVGGVLGNFGLTLGKFGSAAETASTGTRAASMSFKKMAGSAMNLVAAGAAILMVSGGLYIMAKAAIDIAAAGPAAGIAMVGMVGAVIALGAGFSLLMKNLTASPAKMAAMVPALLALGAAVVMVGAGLAIMAESSIRLASAGTPAIAVMVGMVAAVALLAAGAAALGPALTAGTVGFIAFGGAIALVGVGVLAASAGITLLATQLPTISEYGLSAAGAIAALGGAMVAFSGGAGLAGTTCIVLGAGLITVGVGLTAAGAGAVVAAAGVTALSAGMVVLAGSTSMLSASVIALGAGLVICGAGLTTIASNATTAAIGFAALGAAAAASFIPIAGGAASTAALTLAMGALAVSLGVVTAECAVMAAAVLGISASMASIQSSSSSAAASLKDMVSSVDVVKSGLDGLGAIATEAVNAFVSAFSYGTPSAQAAGQAMGTAVTTGVQTGLAPLPSVVQNSMTQTNAALTNGTNQAKSITTSTMSQANATVSSGMSQINNSIHSNLSSAVSYIRSLAGQAYGWGADIIAGLARGIYANLSSLHAAVMSAANVIRSNLHFSVPDEGPLTDYESWMPDFMEGLAKGINDNRFVVRSAMQNVAEDMVIKPDESTSGLFSESDTSNLKSYNITLVNTLGIYKQLVEQMKMCQEYSMQISGERDNGLLSQIERNNTVANEVAEKENNNSGNDKPDTLVIPINIGDEQIETVVVDLLRREVRT